MNGANASSPMLEPRYEPITQIFSAQARKSPESVAVSQYSRTWTYEELATSAISTAQLLILHGLQPGQTVAVTGSRSFGLVSAMLAALFARGVLLPIDPSLPELRQRWLWEQSASRHMLFVGDVHDQPRWVQQCCQNVITIPASESHRETRVNDVVLPGIDPNDPAYIFFTSGTTGLPKGVKGCHKGLAHFLTWQRDRFSIGPGDRSAQLTNLSFDVVLRDIFTPLLGGATLCLPPETMGLSASQVLPWLEEQNVTMLHTVPSLAQSWMGNATCTASEAHLRLTFFAGEPLRDSLVRLWHRRFPSSTVVNLYGPTETTLAKFFYVVPSNPCEGNQPVGAPLPNTEAILLNEQGHLCGEGEPGEVLIRTPFRSLGYLNSAEEKSKRFVPNPFRTDPKDVLYRTGDRGRFRPDGALELLGRLDNQVKIRGVRVEPEEVAAILGQHPDVEQAIVLPKLNETKEYSLIAYVISNSQDSGKLMDYLRDRLAAAMLPSRFVFVPHFPLTPNGKVDRAALAAMTPENNVPSSNQFIPPCGQLEVQLAQIWKDVLKIDSVGIEDNFFDIGGNSLLIMEVHGRLRTLLRRELAVTTLFQYPTINSLATFLDKRDATPSLAASIRSRFQTNANRSLEEG